MGTIASKTLFAIGYGATAWAVGCGILHTAVPGISPTLACGLWAFVVPLTVVTHELFAVVADVEPDSDEMLGLVNVALTTACILDATNLMWFENAGAYQLTSGEDKNVAGATLLYAIGLAMGYGLWRKSSKKSSS